MADIKLNADICKAHLEALKTANEQWFYGYHFSKEDVQRLEASLTYFEYIKEELQKKLDKEAS